MITSIQNDSYEQILENLPYVFPEFEEGKKLQRRIPKITEAEFSAYRKKLEDSKHDILKSTPKISKIAIDTSNNELSTEEFPFVGDAPEGAKKSKKGRFAKRNNDISDIMQNPRIIFFVIGGLSHHELVSLHKIQQEGVIQCQIISGSTNIMRPNEFLTMLKDVHKHTLKDNPFSSMAESVFQKAKFEEEKI